MKSQKQKALKVFLMIQRVKLYSPKKTSQFKKDFKKYSHSGRYDISKLKDIVSKLINGEKLPSQNRDHPLKGNLSDFRECHIEPDWLLLYRYENEFIIFTRTGSHSELFK